MAEAVVSLTPIAQPAHNTIRDVRFAMREGGMLMFVVVTHAALESMASSTPGAEDHLGRFEQNRNAFERIAIQKYERGDVDDEGFIFIQKADLQSR